MRGRWVGWCALMAAAAAALPACDDGGSPARGFGSRQLLSTRDSTFSFEGSVGDLVLYSFATDPPSYWSVDVGTGAVTARDATFSDVSVPSYSFPADPKARFHCTYTSSVAAGSNTSGVAGGSQLVINDGQTGQQTIIHDVAGPVNCPTEDAPTIKIWRRDDSGHLTLWTGPYDDLRMAPVDLAVVHIIQFRPTDASASVLAARAAQPDALGIFAIDLTTFAISEMVSPVLGNGAWAEGATPAGALDSASLVFDPATNLWGAFRIADHFGYWRRMGDGGAALFVGPLASGTARERALFQQATPTQTTVPVTWADGVSASPVPSVWRQAGASDASDLLLIWDDVRQRLVTCSSPWRTIPLGIASNDRSKLAFVVLQDPINAMAGFYDRGPLLLADLASPDVGSSSCKILAEEVAVADFSPDGSALFWLAHPPYPTTDAELWLAAADGSAARLVGADQIRDLPNPPRFVGQSQLELELEGDLVWIDTRDDSFLTHTIAAQVSGTAIDRGRWLITGYDASEQDGTARLGVVNRDTGDARLISAAVKTFMSPDIRDPLTNLVIPSPSRTAADPIRVVYLVRGRNPSSQDGLWVATINASDTP